MAKDTNKTIVEKVEIPAAQKIEPGMAKKGATIPEMQPIKPATSTTGQSGSQGSQSGSDSGKAKD